MFIPFGIISGLYLDFIIGKNIGTFTIMYGIIGIIGGYFDKNFKKSVDICLFF